MQGWETVLVGRRSCLTKLRSVAEDAAKGTGALVLIEGEAGMGKTCVAEAGASIARELAFHVAWGRAHELQQHRPFGPVVDAMGISPRAPDPRRAVIGRLLREHASAESVDGPGQFRVIDAVVDLAESLTLEQSLLLVLDDLHWADPASLRVIGALATRLVTTRLLVVATFRPVPRSPELEAFLAEWGHQAVRERLQPLTREAAVQLATALLGAEPSPEVIRVLGEAGGNPLFVTELLDGLVDQGAIELTDAGAVLVHDEPPATSTLMNAIMDRLRIVRGEVTQTLRVVPSRPRPRCALQFHSLGGPARPSP